MKHWKMWAVMGLIVVMLVATGCNTLRGAGRDIQRAGQKVEEVAR